MVRGGVRSLSRGDTLSPRNFFFSFFFSLSFSFVFSFLSLYPLVLRRRLEKNYTICISWREGSKNSSC